MLTAGIERSRASVILCRALRGRPRRDLQAVRGGAAAAPNGLRLARARRQRRLRPRCSRSSSTSGVGGAGRISRLAARRALLAPCGGEPPLYGDFSATPSGGGALGSAFRDPGAAHRIAARVVHAPHSTVSAIDVLSLYSSRLHRNPLRLFGCVCSVYFAPPSHPRRRVASAHGTPLAIPVLVLGRCSWARVQTFTTAFSRLILSSTHARRRIRVGSVTGQRHG